MPSDYISELAGRSYETITADEWQRTEEISCQVPAKPATVDELKAALEERPGLQAQVAWKTGYTPTKWLLEHELEAIKKRRDSASINVPVEPSGDAYDRAAKSGLMGICFSGGGIRSATFNLGILQGLAELKLLKCFDYLSSVSGGGYIHQWLAAWIKRESTKEKKKGKESTAFDKVNGALIPPPEPGSPDVHAAPIRWLRRYSNYLTPNVGLFTADTWVVIATWLRNTILNQMILVSGLLFLVLLPHILTFHFLVPENGIGAAIAIGIILYLFFLATFFLGKNLFRFSDRYPWERGLFAQRGAQFGIVIPLLASSLIFTSLFPITSATRFEANLVICFFAAALLLMVLSLAIIFWGGAPLSYLKSHHRTAGYTSFREFWSQSWCWAHLRMALVIAGLLLAAGFVAVCGAAWIALTDYWMAKLWSAAGHSWWRLVLVLDPPLVVIGILLALILLLGILGRTFDDGRREWLARLGAWTGLYALIWIAAVGLSLFGYAGIQWFGTHFKTMIAALVTWISGSGMGLIAGKSSQTAGSRNDETRSRWNWVEVLATVGPYIFITGLLLLLSALAEVLLQYLCGYGWLAILLLFVAPLAICLLFAWRVDINEFSMHAFYRNRLARCYLGASNASRDPNPFSGFDERDAEIAVSKLQPDCGYYGPFPVFCTTLNLAIGEDLAWQERKAASFAFTPLYSGYDVGWTAARGTMPELRFNGFAKTVTYAYPQPGIHVATAAAISGAALSPNWGYHTKPATAFLLTVFNVRLGWWLRNPRAVDENGKRLNIPKNEISPKRSFRGAYPSASPRLSLLYLLNELLGQTNDTRQFVYLSDGGHFDNMGLYELVRRRCRYIVICDAEEDGSLQFEGIGMAIRKCRIDFGAEVALDLRPLQHIGNTGYSRAHCVVGTIRYATDALNERPGVVVYIKSSLTGDEPGDVLNYKKEDPAFPNDTTLNQWFTESQFESYRRLGHHVAYSTFEPARPEVNHCIQSSGRDVYFGVLRGIWYARTPEMDLHSAEHSRRYENLLRRIWKDQLLPGFYDRLFVPRDVFEWEKEPGRTQEQIQRARAVSSDLIEFIFLVYLELNLVFPEKREHPFAKGWYKVFRNWTQIDSVQEGWRIYRHGYSRSFRLFARTELGLEDS